MESTSGVDNADAVHFGFQQYGISAALCEEVEPRDQRRAGTLARLDSGEGLSLVELLQAGRQAVLAAHNEATAAVAVLWNRRSALLRKLSYERRMHRQLQASSSKRRQSSSFSSTRVSTQAPPASTKTRLPGDIATSSNFAAWVWTREGLVPASPASSASVSSACGPVEAAITPQPWHLVLMEGLAKKLLLRCALLALREAFKLGALQRAVATSARLGTPKARRLLRLSWHAFRALLLARRHRVRAVLSIEHRRSTRAASNALACCVSFAAKRRASRQQLQTAECFWSMRRAVHALLTFRNYAYAKLRGLPPLDGRSPECENSEKYLGKSPLFSGLKLHPGRALISPPLLSVTRRSRSCPISLLPLRSFSLPIKQDYFGCNVVSPELMPSSHESRHEHRLPSMRNFRSSALSAEASAWGRRRAAAFALAALHKHAVSHLRSISAISAANTHRRRVVLRNALACLVPSCRQLRHAHMSWALSEAWWRRRPLALGVAQWQLWTTQRQHAAAQRAKGIVWHQQRCMVVGLRRWWRGLVLRRRLDRILEALADLSNHRRLLKAAFRTQWACTAVNVVRSSGPRKNTARVRRVLAQNASIRATNHCARRQLMHGLEHWRFIVMQRQERALRVRAHIIALTRRWFSSVLRAAGASETKVVEPEAPTTLTTRAAAASLSSPPALSGTPAVSEGPPSSMPSVVAAAKRMAEAEAEDALLADAFDAKYSSPKSRRYRCAPAASASVSADAQFREPLSAITTAATTNATSVTPECIKISATDDMTQLFKFVIKSVKPILGPSSLSNELHLSMARECTAENIALAVVADVFCATDDLTRKSTVGAHHHQEKSHNFDPGAATLTWFGPLAAVMRARKRALKQWQQWGQKQRFHRSVVKEAQRCRLRSYFGALALYAAIQNGSRACIVQFKHEVDYETLLSAATAHAADRLTLPRVNAFPHCVGAHFPSTEKWDGNSQRTCRCCLLDPTSKIGDAVGMAIGAAERPLASFTKASQVVASLQKEQLEKHQRAWLRLALVSLFTHHTYSTAMRLSSISCNYSSFHPIFNPNINVYVSFLQRCLREEASASSLASRVASARAESHYHRRGMSTALSMLYKEANCQRQRKARAQEKAKHAQSGLSKAASRPFGHNSAQHTAPAHNAVPLLTPPQEIPSHRPNRILQPRSTAARPINRISAPLKRSAGSPASSVTATTTTAVPKYSYASLVKASPRSVPKPPASPTTPTTNPSSKQTVPTCSVFAGSSDKENRLAVDKRKNDLDVLAMDQSWCLRHYQQVSARQALRRLQVNIKQRQQERTLEARLEQFLNPDVGGDSTPLLMLGSEAAMSNERAEIIHSNYAGGRRRAWAFRRPVACACFSRWRQFVAGRLLLGRVVAFALERWNVAVSDGVVLTRQASDGVDSDDDNYAEVSMSTLLPRRLLQPPLCRGLPLARVARRVLFAWAGVARVSRRQAREASRAAATALWSRVRLMASVFEGWRAVVIEAAAARRAARNRLVQAMRSRCLSRTARAAASLALQEWQKWAKRVIRARSEAAAAQAHLQAQRARVAAKALGLGSAQPRTPLSTLAAPQAPTQQSRDRRKDQTSTLLKASSMRRDVCESSNDTAKKKLKKHSKVPQNKEAKRRNVASTKRAPKSKTSGNQSGVPGTESQSSGKSELSTVEGTTKETHYVEVLDDASTLVSAPYYSRGNHAANALPVEPEHHVPTVASISSDATLTATDTDVTPVATTNLNLDFAASAVVGSSTESITNAVTDAAASDDLARRAAALRAEAILAQAALELAHRNAEMEAEQLRRIWRGLSKLSACLIFHRANRVLNRWPGRAAWARAYQHFARRGLRVAIGHWRKQPALAQARAKKIELAKALSLQFEARRAVAAAASAAAERRAALPVWVAPNHHGVAVREMGRKKVASKVPWGLSHPTSATTRPYLNKREEGMSRPSAFLRTTSIPVPSSIVQAQLGMVSTDAGMQARAIVRAWRRIARQLAAGRKLGNVVFTVFQRLAGLRLSFAWSTWSLATFAAEKQFAAYSSSSTFGTAAGYAH